MEGVKNILEKNTIVVLNEALKQGFTQLPRYILKDKKLSFGARLTYAVLLSYAWQDDSCFPGQDKIAGDLGVSRQAVNGYLTELKDNEYINWERRGLGKTNIYYILDYKPLKI
jgi:DNA-binding MarR family transcriptional regulator